MYSSGDNTIELDSDGYYLVNNDGSISFETGGNTYWDTQLSVIPDIRKR